MFKSGIESFARSIFLTMDQQIVLHHPEIRDEALNWYNDVIQFFLNSTFEDDVIDSDLIALLISNISGIEGRDLMPEIEKLCYRRIVVKGICGDWEAVTIAFNRPVKHNRREEILTMIECHKHVTSTWAGRI